MATDLTPKALPTINKALDFPFSLHLGGEHSKEILARRNATAEKIAALISQFSDKTETHPELISWILDAFTEPDGGYKVSNLNILGKVLQALARELTSFQELEGQLSFVEYALQHPEFVALIFAETGSVVDDFLSENDLSTEVSEDPFAGL